MAKRGSAAWKAKKKAQEQAKKRKAKARLKIKKLTKQATKDRNLSKAEVKKVRKVARRNNITTGIGLKKAQKKTKSKLDTGAKKFLKKANKKWTKDNPYKPKPTEEEKDNNKPSVPDNKKEDKKEDKKKDVKVPDIIDDATTENPGNERKKDAYEDDLKDDKKDQEDAIKNSDKWDSKKYRKLDYEKSLKEGAERARQREEDARKDYKGAERLSISRSKISSLKKKTGYKDIEERLTPKGNVRDKAGARRAKRPDLEKYKQKISKVQSPYSKLLKGIGGEDTQYDKESRRERSKNRLKSLTKRWNPESPSPFGNKQRKSAKHQRQGRHLLRMSSFSDEKSRKYKTQRADKMKKGIMGSDGKRTKGPYNKFSSRWEAAKQKRKAKKQ